MRGRTLCGLLGLLILIPMAQAQISSVQGAFLGVETRVTYDDVKVYGVAPSSGPFGLAAGGLCDEGEPAEFVRAVPGGRGFRFLEPAEQHGCAVVAFEFRIDGPTDEVMISWSVLQRVYQAASDDLLVGGADIDVVLGIRVSDDTGQILEERAFGEPGAARWDGDERLIIAHDALSEASSLTVEWIFIDRGPEIRDEVIIPGGGQEVLVDIIAPTVAYRYRVADLQAWEDRVDVGRDQIIKHVHVPVTVPAGVVSVAFQAHNELSIHHVILPDGRTLANQELVASEGQGAVTLSLERDTLERYGSGTYTAVFQAQTALEPTPFLIPIIGLIMMAPAGLGIYASRSATRFTASATETFSRAAKSLHFTLAFWWAVYVAAFAAVIGLRMWPLIVSWPIELEAALMHGLFVLISLAFIALGFYWRRQLAHTMQEELAQKERAFKDLVRSNEELQQFAYVASHDLQEPLRTVSRFTQLLEHRYGEKLDQDAKEFMAFTVDGAKRMQALIDDLLRFSRVETRGKPLVPVHLYDVVDRAVRSLTASLDDSGGRIEINSLPYVLGDEVQLGQVFQNLLGNAIKFRDPTRKPKVEVSATKQGKEWVIAIKDNGIGIPKEHHERIFVVFQRLHARDEYEGTGIGLALCKKIVERHGGQIWLESEPGKGTTFFLTLVDGHLAPERQRGAGIP